MNIESVKIILLTALCFFCAACSPYQGQLAQLDEAYRAGAIDKREYYQRKMALSAADAQWRQEARGRMMAASAASIAQSNAQIQANQQRQWEANQAMINRPMPPPPRTYDSTVTPSLYPGGTYQIHTRETGY